REALAYASGWCWTHFFTRFPPLRVDSSCNFRTSRIFERRMKSSYRSVCVLLICAPLLAGCELFSHFTHQKSEKLDKEPLAGAPGKYNFRVSQFLFLSDVEINHDLPIFKDLANLREQVYRDLRLPPSNTEIWVYLFENKALYEKYMHAKHPELPDRRAFFV